MASQLWGRDIVGMALGNDFTLALCSHQPERESSRLGWKLRSLRGWLGSLLWSSSCGWRARPPESAEGSPELPFSTRTREISP